MEFDLLFAKKNQCEKPAKVLKHIKSENIKFSFNLCANIFDIAPQNSPFAYSCYF
jgi:hypothetical protein